MPNDYFQFKQFTVYHDRCAMKVGTDGVLLGAWADVSGASSILDVGSGSGLIALMMAQRTESAKIFAVEIDRQASDQSKENYARSPWNDRLIPVNDSFQHFAQTTSQRFDLIISNPPFFSNSLKAAGQERTDARHDDSLPHPALLHHSSVLLNEHGKLAVIIPFDICSSFISAAAAENLFCIRKTLVSSKPGQAFIRALLEFSKKPHPVEKTNFVIYTGANDYSAEYKNLTKDFYLNF